MRASRSPAARAARQHLGDHRHAGDRGRLRSLPLAAEIIDQRVAAGAARRRAISALPGAPSELANTSVVATATPGLTSTAAKRRQRERRRQNFADAAHDARRADRGRPARRRRSPARRAARRGSSGASRWRAPAAAAPPPHRPSRRRGRPRPASRLVERESAPSLRPVDLRRAARARALQHQIVGDRPACGGERTAHRPSVAAPPGCKREPIGHARERHQAFELVIAVGAAAEHAQRQIDLGRRRVRPARAAASRQPDVSRRRRTSSACRPWPATRSPRAARP